MAIVLVQSAVATAVQASNTSISISKTFTSGTTSGNFLLAVARGIASASPTASMTTSGVTWVALGTFFESATSDYICVFYAFNTSAVTSATNNTFATTAQTTVAGLTLYEFSGLGTGSLDTHVTNFSSSGNTPNPGSITCANAGELVFATWAGSYSSSSGGGKGINQRSRKRRTGIRASATR